MQGDRTNEKDLSTKQNQTQKDTRISRAHAHQERQGCNQQKKGQGQKKIGGLNFPKHLRLVRRSQFQACYLGGRSYQTKHFIIFVRPNGRDYWRLGITASRKIGPAVLRNRIKRLVREAFRLNQGRVPRHLDYVVVSKKRTDLRRLNLDMVQEQLLYLFQKIRPRPEKDLEQSHRA